MTISNTSRAAGPFAGTGANISFPFAFKVFARSDLLVARTITATGIESILVLDVDYTVVLNPNQNSNPGGIITLSAALAVGTTLAATSNLPIQQSLELTNQGGFYPTVINDALDRIVITIQQLSAKIGLGALNVGAAATIAAILATLTNLASSTGSSIVGFIQAGVGAIVRTLQAKNRDTIDLADFGAVPDTGADMGLAISRAVAQATLEKKELVSAGGEFLLGVGTSLTFDPSRFRFRGRGPVAFRWMAAPTAGYAVNILNSETAPYETARRTFGRITHNLSILGSTAANTLFNATGVRHGNGVNQTYGYTISHGAIAGWTTCEEYTNNTWWISHEKIRIMWGAISTPVASGNWGENNTYYDCQLLDGVIATFNYGEFRFFAGSLDNSKVVVNNIAMVSWASPHIENPGTVTLTQPFIDVQGTEANCVLNDPMLVVNNNGTAITQSPFNVAVGNQNNGLVVNNLQYTQGGHARWYSLVSGGGRVRASGLLPLAFANFNFQVLAENTRGKLRNYGFETGDMSGWAVTANTSFGTTGTATSIADRPRPGSTGTRSCRLSVVKTADVYGDVTIGQTVAIQSNELLMVGFSFSRQYTSVSGQFSTLISWLDAAGTVIGSFNTGYVSAAAGTDDGAAASASRHNVVAPGGTVRALVQVTLQSLSGIGTANLFVDDVFVNVVV